MEISEKLLWPTTPQHLAKRYLTQPDPRLHTPIIAVRWTPSRTASAKMRSEATRRRKGWSK